tara:strand:- start:74 stop:250 length:177 start_codon:yes stop_codon:yes gene_type:complete
MEILRNLARSSGTRNDSELLSPIFEKKSWGVRNGGKPPFLAYFGGFWPLSLHLVIEMF